MRLPVLFLLAAFAARADEGMWTYDNFPSKQVGRKYKFAPDKAWLDEARLSSVRLVRQGSGCSASFVSPEGLIMTNHHCAQVCIAQLSTKERDFIQEGFYAPRAEDEVKCPELEADQLVQIADVTRQVHAATKGLKPGKEFNDRRKAAMAALEKDCAGGDEKLRCDVVELYHGGQYSLYKYKRYQDVRLVFAPEFAVAFFGGDPDNFNFPRYDLDVSFIRVWEDGRPLRAEHWFGWSQAGAKAGDLTFVSGNPGATQRGLTMAELRYQRDVDIPERLLHLAQFRGALTVFADQSPERHRIAASDLFSVENSFKVYKGRFEALTTPSLWNELQDREDALRAKVLRRPSMKRRYGSAWDDAAKAIAAFEVRHAEYMQLEEGYAFAQWKGVRSQLFSVARALVRGTEELQKPNDQRLREYTDGQLPQLKAALFSKAPIEPELELFKLSYSLTKMREILGADHPFVRKVLGKRSPQEVAQDLVKSKLYDVRAREALWQGGRGAVQASTDPMIEFARFVDPDSRAVRKWHDEEIEPRQTAATERIAAARFDIQGKSTYPDATFTLRLSYGTVRGWREGDHDVAPVTTFAGAFDRATGRDPFKLPDSWLIANQNKQIDLSAPLDFCTDNDVVGGSSGSPAFDKERRVVGLVFDINIHALGGDYGFDEAMNRTVLVEAPALIEALDHIYGAKRVVMEIKGQR